MKNKVITAFTGCQEITLNIEFSLLLLLHFMPHILWFFNNNNNNKCSLKHKTSGAANLETFK